jgi:hypothetical protein
MKFKNRREKQLFVSSVPVRKIGSDKMPRAIASGCLADYGNKRILLTVAHATKKPGKWAIELRYEPGQGTKLYSVGAMNFLKKGTLQSGKLKLKDVDFSYVQVPADLEAFRQEIIDPVTIKEEIPIMVHKLDFAQPSRRRSYGFCGTVLPSVEKHGSQKYLFAELKTYDGLRYLRSEGDYHIFRLPMAHPGHEQFQGCSGAPILDRVGRVVGLVCGGNTDTNEIWAISPARYRTALDILVGKIR